LQQWWATYSQPIPWERSWLTCVKSLNKKIIQLLFPGTFQRNLLPPSSA
jgi:hypothetical protein